MKKDIYKKTAALSVALLAAASMASAQVDQAAATANLAKLNTISVMAKGNVAASAKSGNVVDLAQANKRSDAVDAAVASGKDAYNAMMAAIQSGDNVVAAARARNLATAVQNANNALNGVMPGDNTKQQWVASKTNTGGGPGSPSDTPNIYALPNQSAAQQAVLNSLSGSINNSGGGGGGSMGGLLGGGSDIGDTDATPN